MLSQILTSQDLLRPLWLDGVGLRLQAARVSRHLITTANPHRARLLLHVGAMALLTARVAQVMLRTSATTFSIWQTRNELRRTARRASGYRNTLQHFNATSARSDSLVRTICAHICALIQMSGLSCVRSVERPLRDNTIASVTKDYTRARRSSSVAEHCKVALNGAVAGVLRVPTLSVVTSVQKQVGSALSLC